MHYLSKLIKMSAAAEISKTSKEENICNLICIFLWLDWDGRNGLKERKSQE
jgi:hypothetical protein